jgi:transcriptional regulator with XRE-family HTH domain
LENTENFCDRLKAARIGHGLSQEDLADKLGVSNGAVGNWETGPTIPRPQMLRKIEELLGVKIEKLLTGHAGAGEINPTSVRGPTLMSHYSWMETRTLEQVLCDLATRLPKSPAAERPPIIANLAAVIDQLAIRERAAAPTTAQTVAPAPLSEAQKIAPSAGDQFDREHPERK